MARLLTELSAIPAPGILTRTAREYWEQYADNPELLDGGSVVHRDPNPTNFVVDGDRAWMVDFGWAVRGPAWMTSANLIVSMMKAGWTAADADDALKAVPGSSGLASPVPGPPTARHSDSTPVLSSARGVIFLPVQVRPWAGASQWWRWPGGSG